MADILSTSIGKQGLSRRKVLSTRVDLTPMVDLGFLLITFFIFTTTMAESKTMRLVMPDDRFVAEPNKHPADKTLFLVLQGEDTISYMTGNDFKNTTATSFSNLRDVIIERKQYLAEKYGSDKDLLVLVQPTDASSFKNLVDVLDEMLINDVRSYMIVDDTRHNDLKMNK